MNAIPLYLVRSVPEWVMLHDAFQALIEHYMEVDEKGYKYHVKAWYEGVFVVLDTHSDDFVYINRGRTKTKKIWKTRVFDEALRYANEMNKEEPPRVYDETSLSQKIGYMNTKMILFTNRKRTSPVRRPTVFKRCACGTMYRGDKHCG